MILTHLFNVMPKNPPVGGGKGNGEGSGCKSMETELAEKIG